MVKYAVEKQMTEACLKKAMPATVHFYLSSPSAPPRPHGNGVLFAFEENYFVLTAAHLLNEDNFEAIRIMVDGQLYSLDGCTFKFALSKDDQNEVYLANIDLAALKLEESSLLTRLKADRSFLGLQDILFDQQQTVGLLPAYEAALSAYYIIGYPASRTNYNEKEFAYHSTLFGIYCTLHKKNLDRLQEKFGNYHLFFDYRTSGKNFKHRNKVQLPSYQGLSGTEIWNADYFNQHGEHNIKLAGILLETSQKDSVIVGLRMDLVIQMLRQHFDLPRLPRRTLN